MITPILYVHPIDKTGVNPNNLIQNEPHAIGKRPIRILTPNFGAFYTDSLALIDQASGLPLIKDTGENSDGQYSCGELYAEPTSRFGKEIMSVILIKDPNVSENVSLTYQCVGGQFENYNQAIIQMYNKLINDNRGVHWDNISGKPENGYPPAKHLHDIGDTYGWEYIVQALERLRQAILIGDAAAHDVMYQYIDDKFKQAGENAQDIMARHLAALDPHPQYYNESRLLSAIPINLARNYFSTSF